MKNSWFTETEVFLLHEIVTRLDRLARERVLAASGVTYAEFLVAMAVNEMEQPTQLEVGALLDMSKSLVSQRVSALMTKGLLVQMRKVENRREVQLDLTDKGQRTLAHVYEELAGAAAPIFDVLGGSRPKFLESLRRVRDAVVAAETS
jgi:DNA-binding MarR family transcriptional regulator